MRTRGRTTRRGGGRGRGFLLLTVLVLLFVSTLMIGWGLRRATMQSRIAAVRIEDYRLHHERLGLIAISERWMRQENAESLAEQALSDRASYEAVLPNDAEIVIRVYDGQGTLCGRTESSTGDILEAMLDSLTLIPAGRSELIRDVGPIRVSLRAAPREVLVALAGGDERTADELEGIRSQRLEDDGQFKLELNRREFDTELLNRLSTMLTVEPTLWRLDTEVTDEHGTRRYQILVEFLGNRVRTHSCRMAAPPADGTGAGGR